MGVSGCCLIPTFLFFTTWLCCFFYMLSRTLKLCTCLVRVLRSFELHARMACFSLVASVDLTSLAMCSLLIGHGPQLTSFFLTLKSRPVNVVGCSFDYSRVGSQIIYCDAIDPNRLSLNSKGGGTRHTVLQSRHRGHQPTYINMGSETHDHTSYTQ